MGAVDEVLNKERIILRNVLGSCPNWLPCETYGEKCKKVAGCCPNARFYWVYDEVEHLYGTNGNVSVPPPVILKLLVLLMLYNVSSEREMMDTLPERLDWL